MFKLIKIENGRGNVPEPVQIPATNGVAYKEGMALAIASNAAAIASGDVTAQYVCLEEKTGVAGGYVLAYRIMPQMIFEVPIQAYSSSTQKFAGKLTFHTDGLQITATAVTNNHGAFIEDLKGATGVGDKVLVRLA